MNTPTDPTDPTDPSTPAGSEGRDLPTSAAHAEERRIAGLIDAFRNAAVDLSFARARVPAGLHEFEDAGYNVASAAYRTAAKDLLNGIIDGAA